MTARVIIALLLCLMVWNAPCPASQTGQGADMLLAQADQPFPSDHVTDMAAEPCGEGADAPGRECREPDDIEYPDDTDHAADHSLVQGMDQGMDQSLIHTDHADDPAVDGNMDMADQAPDQAMDGDTDMDMAHDTDHADHDMDADADMNADMDMTDHVHPTAEPEQASVGVDEKLGQYIPMDLVFVTVDGREAPLSELIHGPTIIAPVYYTCPSACNLLQSALANVLPQMGLTPGEEYQVLSVSFDPADTPEIARRKKTDYFTAIKGKTGESYPEDAWLFLTAKHGEEARLMDAIGFRYQKEGDAFLHPVIVVAVSPDGKIVRYLYGQGFLPFDLAMAATEAAEGHVGLSVKRVLAYCFTYDPEGKKYAFNFIRVSGAAILTGMFIFFLALLLAGRKKKRKG